MHVVGATKKAERSDDLEAVRRGESAVFEKFSCRVFVESWHVRLGALSQFHTAVRQLAPSIHFNEGRAAEGRRLQKRLLTRKRLPPT